MDYLFQRWKACSISFLFAVSFLCADANIQLPSFFSSNMVLQRQKPIKIWGTATGQQSVIIKFGEQQLKVKVAKDGQWSATFKAMEAGGPYDLVIKDAQQHITLNNILIGDVWLCSGQSNMEMSIASSANAEKEIKESNHPGIRLLTVQRAQNYFSQKDISSKGWTECNPGTSADFSAVAYFFARKVNKETDVPIGLIHSSWGGTNIQAWTSWDSMSKQEHYRGVNLKEKQDALDAAREKENQFQQSLKKDKGTIERWFDPSQQTSDWKNTQLPGTLEQTEIGNADGVVWFKREFELPSVSKGDKFQLSLGHIDDMDETYVNGKIVGTSEGWNIDRLYIIDESILRTGKNIITIKVTDRSGPGGFFASPEQMYVQSGNKKISLAGTWQYKAAVLNTGSTINEMGPNSFPSQLFNAMIAPLTAYPVKGVIWYQGESNVPEAYQYRNLFPRMINDWRSRWGYDFPFVWVQLANFLKPDSLPGSSEWAELREAQSITLKMPNTAQAVIIDIGEENDIHPRNKQDVGYRLALGALHIAYDSQIVYSGPVYKSMQIMDNKIALTFSQTGSGLKAADRYGYVKGFAIAGADKQFHWAQAIIENDKIIVWSKAVSDPVAVRYAWGNNPYDANVYNKEGLPASPFRTDEWDGITKGKDMK